MTGPILVLVGAPGAGKTTVGGRVAVRSGVPFRDTDHLIEERAGKSVSDIFIEDGEPAFRELERQTVAEALRSFPGVLALGGGAIIDEGTQDLLRDRTVGWLRVGINDASRRVGLNVSRPLLVGNVRGRLSALLDERTPLYEKAATFVVDTDGRSIDQVVTDVLAGLAVVSGSGGKQESEPAHE